MANELKMVFGSTTTVISLAGALNNGSNVYSGDGVTTFTQLDNSTSLYPYAKAVLNIADTFAAAPSAGATVDLFVQEDDVDGTTDETPVPAASALENRARYLGSWVIEASDIAHVKAISISLEGIVKGRFFIRNSTGQQISYSSNPTTVKITPYTYVPAA